MAGYKKLANSLMLLGGNLHVFATNFTALDTNGVRLRDYLGNIRARLLTQGLWVGSDDSSFANGVILMGLANATTVPNQNPVGGVLFYSDAGVLKVRNPNGVIVSLGPLVVAPVTLTDGATVAVNAALGNVFRLTAAGDRTLLAPTNPSDGQNFVVEHTASGGARTLALTTGSAGSYAYGSDLTALTATSSGKTDRIGFTYRAAENRWWVTAYMKGF